jgi:hypothetical protein
MSWPPRTEAALRAAVGRPAHNKAQQLRDISVFLYFHEANCYGGND